MYPLKYHPTYVLTAIARYTGVGLGIICPYLQVWTYTAYLPRYLIAQVHGYMHQVSTDIQTNKVYE